jgi:Tfp pilus assembly protein PilO
MNDVRQRTAEIQSFNSVGSDTSRLYGLIMDLADSRGVRVQGLQPTSVKQSSDDARIAVTRIALSAQGEYDAIGRFVEDVCELNAFVRPVSVDLTPSRLAGTTVVDFNFTCDFFSFTMDPSLVSLGADHEQP